MTKVDHIKAVTLMARSSLLEGGGTFGTPNYHLGLLFVQRVDKVQRNFCGNNKPFAQTFISTSPSCCFIKLP
jgi:hypothetical protein